MDNKFATEPKVEVLDVNYYEQAENTVSAPLNAAKFIRSRSKYNKALQEAMESGFGN